MSALADVRLANSTRLLANAAGSFGIWSGGYRGNFGPMVFWCKLHLTVGPPYRDGWRSKQDAAQCSSV